MIRSKIQIDGGEVKDFFKEFGFIYMDADERTAPDEKEDAVTSYAEEAGEHRDGRTVDAPFDYTAKFLVEAPNKDLTNVNVKIGNFNRAIRNQIANSDVKYKKEIAFYNLLNRVKIVGTCDLISVPTEVYHSNRYGYLDFAVVELKIRVSDPKKCDFNYYANLRGQFSSDSTEEDWYWWPNGVKTPLEVDPITKRFEMDYDEVLNTTQYLFSGGSNANSFYNQKLISIESLPKYKSCGGMLCKLRKVKNLPAIDLGSIGPTYNIYYTANYVMLDSDPYADLEFINTERITQFEMFYNNWPYGIGRVRGLDLSSCYALQNQPFGRYSLLQAINLGKAQQLSSADLRSNIWGDDSLTAGARQSVVDTLLTNSFDRVAAGYDAVNVRLSAYTYSVLTADEIAAITAKGYTLTQE